MAFTAMARMAAAAGRPQDALAAVKELLEGPLPARLRSFAPALKAFAVQGLVDEAFEVSWISFEALQ